MVNILGKELEKEQEQQLKIILLLLVAGACYYFAIYLPQEEIRKLEMQIQTDIDKLKNIQSRNYSDHLKKLQDYLKWKDESEFQQSALNNKKKELNEAIQWLQIEQIRHGQELLEEAQKKSEEEKLKAEKKAKEKKLHWQRKSHNWADELLHGTIKTNYEEGWSKLKKVFGNREPDTCTFGAQYTIHFPPNCWNKLTDEQKYIDGIVGGRNIKPGINFIDKEEDLLFTNKKILEWEKKVMINPTRGLIDKTSGKDNNALFYGAPGTGKTSITKRLCLRNNRFPMIEIKGSSLTPTLSDQDSGILPLQKFVYTISDITWNLVDNFGFNRASDGEVRYILFVDEANQISENSLKHSPSYLRFLKECMEGVNKEKQSQNLWIFATNYLDEVDKAVYRPGRLSNPLDFSWTLGDFYEHSKKVGIYSQFPRHWIEKAVLKKADNEFVNKFSIKSFHELFLPFWKKFIIHPETQKDLPEIEPKNATEEKPAQPGIQLGEFFEFFWNLKETGQLHHFNGKWENPRDDKLEDVTGHVRDTIDVRTDETNDLLQQIGTAINDLCSVLKANSSSVIELKIRNLEQSIIEIRNKLNE